MAIIYYFFALIVFVFSIIELTAFTFLGNLIAILLLFKALDEQRTKFVIYNNKINYQTIFRNRKIDISDLSTIEYNKTVDYGRYHTTGTIYDVRGYMNKNICFSISHVIPENLEIIKKVQKKIK